MKEKLSERKWFIVTMCILFFPVGLYLLWTKDKFSKNAKIAITSILAIAVIASRTGDDVNKNIEKQTVAPIAKNTSQPEEDNKSDVVKTKDIKEIPKEVPKETSQSRNLGVSISDIKFIFENPEIGFMFNESPLSDGTPRQLGQSQNGKGSGLIELYGKENLEKVYLATIAVSDNIEHNVFNLIYMNGLLKNVVPEFENSETWLNQAISSVAQNPEEPIIKTLGDKNIKLELQETLGMFALTIEPI